MSDDFGNLVVWPVFSIDGKLIFGYVYKIDFNKFQFPTAVTYFKPVFRFYTP